MNNQLSSSDSTNQIKSPSKAILIISSLFLEFEDKSLFLDDGSFVHTDETLDDIDARFNNPDIWLTLGKSFKENLVGFPYFVFTFSFNTEEELDNLVLKYKSMIDTTLTFLWFVKDHSAFVSSFGCYIDNTLSRNGYSQMTVSKADGQCETVKFSTSEFNSINSIYKSFVDTGIARDVKRKRVPVHHLSRSSVIFNVIDDLNDNKIERAIRFLINARKAYDLPEKISYYVLVLECLFSAGESLEISHKISERIAIYIGETSESRLLIYKEIKELYNIRSKYIHGQRVLGKKMTRDNLTLFSVKADEYVRQILRKVIECDSIIFRKDDALLNNWFNHLVLSK